MKVSVEELINFVIENGENLDLTMSQIDMVGVERVLSGIDSQTVACTAALVGIVPHYQEHTDATSAMFDYFCDGGFSRAFDSAWINS